MSRTYDYKLTVQNYGEPFEVGQTVDNDNGAKAFITAVKGNEVFVILEPDSSLFSVGDVLLSHSDTFNKTEQDPSKTKNFTGRAKTGETDLGDADIDAIERNPIIARNNAFEQAPTIRLISIYYPGEWYEAGSEHAASEYGWPYPFPLRVCQSDNYTQPVVFNDKDYISIPIELSQINESTDGSLGQTSIRIFNAHDVISSLVDDPNLSGYNVSNTTSAVVDGKLVKGIDPRTVPNNPAYSSAIVGYYNRENAAMDKAQSDSLNGIWRSVRLDSRDLLGAIVEIKTTSAEFLKYKPEYSTITQASGNTITMKSASEYRVGDVVSSNSHSSEAMISSIDRDAGVITMNTSITASIGDRLYVVNELAQEESTLVETFKVDQLEGLNSEGAEFTLTTALTATKTQLPKLRYLKTCMNTYKDKRCKYNPAPGSPIQGAPGRTSNGYFDAQNNSTTENLDYCNKSMAACRLRGNEVNYLGFITSGTN